MLPKSLVIAGVLLTAPVSQAANILMVTDDNTRTQSLANFLAGEGHTVTRNARTSGPGNTSGFDLVIVAYETNSGRYDEGTEPRDWNTLGLPMICMTPQLMSSSRWGWMNGTSLPRFTGISRYDSPFVAPSHPIALGATSSMLSPAGPFTGAASALPSGTVQIATIGSGASHGIFVIPAGTNLGGNFGTTGDIRIGFLRGKDGSWNNVTPNVELLLSNTISYALGIAPAPPVIDNGGATDIEPTSATVTGVVTDPGSSIPNVTIYHGTSDGGTNPGAWDADIKLGSRSGAFSAGLTGLPPGTTYYFRCYGQNAGGDDWADSTASFTTTPPPNPPTVVNHPASNIDFTMAELNGEVTNTGGEVPTVTIHWGPDDGGTNPAAWPNSIDLGQEAGSFTREVVGLTHGTTYHFRCSASNAGGTSWASPTASFTTPAYGLPAVTSGTPSNVTGLAAGIDGAITDTGGDPPLVTVYFGLADGGTNPVAWDDSRNLGAQGGSFTAVLTGLTSSTTYHFRIHALNEAGGVWSSASGSFTTGVISSLIINEFLASNDGTYSSYPEPNQLPDRADDWIEILNTSASPLALDGWHLTDDAGDPGQWEFPPGTTIGAGEFLVVYASGDGVPDPNGNLHTNFKLGAAGEHVALTRPDLSVASGFGPGGTDFPEQDTDISYGFHPVTALPVFFSVPTPGAPNDLGGINRVKDTTFSIDRGIYSAPFSVAINTDTNGATIYYSTDGNPPIDAGGAPTSSATVYASPVSISKTTILRAAAVKTGLAPTNIDTQTYLLIDIDNAGPDGLDPGGLNAIILEQTRPAGFPTLADSDDRTEDDGDYDMDQSISKSTDQAIGLPAGTTRAQALVRGLVDIPTLSIAMDIDDFAGPANGIYTHANSSGFAWERACSVELIQGDNSEAWQEDCGIRVQGGASRTRSPKHGLSLRFRERYGAGKLRQDLFPESDVRRFDTLALRAGYNNSWIHWSAAQRDRGSMIRDQWARGTLLDMGNTEAGHGMMVHLYINGLYWGVHNLTERQDSSHYAAHNGGDEDLLDARNATSFVDGDSTAWNEMVTIVNSGDWSRIQQVLDVDNHIDYQIMNRYGANSDLHPGNNWRAAGGGPFPPGQPELMAPWQLYSWDAERILESPTNNGHAKDPTELRTTLLAHPEYRIRFIDRLQKHFFNGGALTPGATQGRWMEWAALLERPIIAEAARWGDHRQDDGDANEVYDRNDDWLTEQARLTSTYFPVRSDHVLDLYRTDNIFPDFDAPEFLVNSAPRHGGTIPTGQNLSLTADEGTIYYTLDGSDPRLEGGTVNPSALGTTSGSPVLLTGSALVRTRTLSSGTWSALNEAVFYVGTIPSVTNLVVSEIMFNPPGMSEEEEFVELMNVSPTDTIDLSDVSFNEGITFVFPVGTTLPPLGRIAVTTNQTAFATAHDASGINIVPGEFTGDLANNGETIGLVDRDGTDLRRFAYDDKHPWPESTDGAGYSLVLVAPTTNPDHARPENWRASVAINGSPGGTDAMPLAGDPDADNDHDGKSALLEHAIGQSDNNATDGPALALAFTGLDVDGTVDAYPGITFTRNLAADDVILAVEVSSDLQSWSDLDVVFISSVHNGDGTSTETWRTVTPLGTTDREFLRLTATAR